MDSQIFHMLCAMSDPLADMQIPLGTSWKEARRVMLTWVRRVHPDKWLMAAPEMQQAVALYASTFM